MISSREYVDIKNIRGSRTDAKVFQHEVVEEMRN